LLPKFDYCAPQTLVEAFTLLDAHREEARVLAGGTDLLVNLRARQEQPRYLIDIKRVKELQDLSFDEKNGLRVGAAVTLNRLIHYNAASKTYPVLVEAASTIGDYQVRNRATLIGNICNASPAADSAPALMVLDATINISNKTSTRQVPIRDFFAGVKKTTLSHNEIVTSVSVPVPPKGAKGGYLKARRTMGEDLAVVGVGGLVVPNDEAGRTVRLAYASVAPTPVRAYDAEKIFEKKKPLNQLLDEALQVVARVVNPISDVRAGREYRANLVRVLTRRLVKQLWEAS
jgi:carbon-monoxide dehydrogenase medium subunit